MNAIARILIFVCGLGTAFAIPTPIPPPKKTYAEACELVLKKYQKVAGKDVPAKWDDTTFPQIVTYTSLRYSVDLQGYVKGEDLTKEKLKESGMEWILTEWGWLITVVLGRDLSQCDTYFVRQSGEVRLLWSTH